MAIKTSYRICNKCVMDTTDPDIQFDQDGICSHCRRYEENLSKFVFTGDAGKQNLKEIVSKIKLEGANKKYDCVIGVSGGVDSTFVAYKAKHFGLRPLAVHLDNGWDSELAVSNIEKIVKKLGIDYYTHVLDWEEFKDLQLAFLRASTPDSEIPSDHAIRALLFETAVKAGVKYILTGHNRRTESHLPTVWSMGHSDWKYISSVHKQFGKIKLRTYPHMSFWAHQRYDGTLKVVPILNYLDYVKKHAIRTLERQLGWKYYGGKHYESIYTRFYQGYILRRKFGYDKRKAHFSSLICSGEMTREEALEELQNEPYPDELLKQDSDYVVRKLGLSHEEFEKIMALPKRAFWDYPSYEKIHSKPVYKSISAVLRFLG